MLLLLLCILAIDLSDPAPTPPPRASLPETWVSVLPPVPPAPPPIPVLPPPPVTTYRLADRYGQVWTSPDPNWLRIWVGRRNAAMGVLGGDCPTGSCSSGAAVRHGLFGGFR